MLRLNRYILALVLWLAFLFNIERLDVDGSDIVNLASSVYIVVLVMVVLGLTLPSYRRVPLWRLHVIAAASFVTAQLVSVTPPDWGGVYTYLTLFGLTATLISVTLAYRVGTLSAEFVDTVQGLLFSDMDGRVFTTQQAEAVFKREMQFSRRANRPLSVILLDTDTDSVHVNLQATALEIQRLLAKRYSLVALARLVARTLRRTDLVLDQTQDGRLVLVMPEMRKEQTVALLERLDDRVRRRLGIELRSSAATFPEQGVTFEELIHAAERDLRPHLGERQGDALAESQGEVVTRLRAMEALGAPVAEQVGRAGDR